MMLITGDRVYIYCIIMLSFSKVALHLLNKTVFLMYCQLKLKYQLVHKYTYSVLLVSFIGSRCI